MSIEKNNMIRIGTKTACILVFYLLFCPGLRAQVDNSSFTRATRGSLDTMAFQTSQKIVKESEGLFEKEIDPKAYFLGPNDILTISIVSAKSREIEAAISPEGFLPIPEVGAINLRDKTLAEAEALVRQKVMSIFKAQEVYILLKQPRKFKVIVTGLVQKPSIVVATALDRVSEVIDKAGGLKFDASIRHITLHRDDKQQVYRVDLLRYFMLGKKDENPTVLGGDRIVVPPSNENSIIEINGEVGSPGKFEFRPGDSLSTLIGFAQGFLYSSFLDSIEIARFSENSSVIKRWIVSLQSWQSLLNRFTERYPEDFLLCSGDRVYVRRIADWQKPRYVAVEGEVRFPGRYPINKTDLRISDILVRAGGYTEDAAIEKAFLVRRKGNTLWDSELERLKKIDFTEMTDEEKKYYRSKIYEQTNVMAIDFQEVVSNPGSEDNVVLFDFDSIYVPQKKSFVNVQGRVNKPGLVIYKPGLNYMDYIELAGGYGYKADEGSTLVTKPKGERFLADEGNYFIEPGDNILVPPKDEITFKDILTTTTQIITILGVLIAVSSAFR